MQKINNVYFPEGKKNADRAKVKLFRRWKSRGSLETTSSIWGRRTVRFY